MLENGYFTVFYKQSLGIERWTFMSRANEDNSIFI
jgi:hypothetical protein